MSLLALTAALLGATPEYSVVVARRIGIEQKLGAELAERLADSLEGQGRHPLGTLMPVADASARLARAGFPDTAVCNGASACVASLAKVCGFQRLVSLQLVKIGNDVALDASVVEGETGQSLAAVTKSIKLKNAGDELLAIAGELLLELSESGQPADAPRDVSLTPRIEPTPPVVIATPGLSTGRKVALGLGGAALAALAVGVGLGVSAMNQSNALSSRDPDYAAKANGVRQTALVADVSYGAAGALAAGGVLAWALSP